MRMIWDVDDMGKRQERKERGKEEEDSLKVGGPSSTHPLLRRWNFFELDGDVEPRGKLLVLADVMLYLVNVIGL